MFGGVGCFPILLQMPFFSAIYFAAQHTEGVAQTSYLGIPLGSPSYDFGCLRRCPLLSSIPLPFTSRSRDEMQREQIKKMIYMEPTHDRRLLPLLTSQCHTLLGCWWFHDDSPTVYRQLYPFVKLRKKVREELAKNPPKHVLSQHQVDEKTLLLNNQLLSQARKTQKSQRWKTTFEIKLRKLSNN